MATKVKNKLSNDYLCIIASGSASLEVYENLDLNKFISLKLFKFMGITLSKDTYVSQSISKDTIILNIFNTIVEK